MNEHTSISILRSILDPQSLSPLIEAAYGLNRVRLQLIKAGILDTYRVLADDGRFILRIYPSQKRPLAEIEAELDFLQFLGSQNVTVSIPIVSIAGKRILTLLAPEGQRCAVLFTYAEGRPMENDPGEAHLYGKILAQIHMVADTFPQTLARTPLDLKFLLDWPLTQLKTFEHRQKDWAYLDRAAEVIRNFIKNLPRTRPQFGYCHGDVCMGNAHITPEGKVTFFDFDFCGLGWRVYDVATFVSGESAPITTAFLAGYQSVRLLTEAEMQAIPLFQVAQSIWMLGTRAQYINEWGNIRFADEFVDRVLDQIRLLANKHDLLGNDYP